MSLQRARSARRGITTPICGVHHRTSVGCRRDTTIPNGRIGDSTAAVEVQMVYARLDCATDKCKRLADGAALLVVCNVVPHPHVCKVRINSALQMYMGSRPTSAHVHASTSMMRNKTMVYTKAPSKLSKHDAVSASAKKGRVVTRHDARSVPQQRAT